MKTEPEETPAQAPSWRRALAAMPKDVRAAVLERQAAAAAAADYYASEVVDSDDDLVEY